MTVNKRAECPLCGRVTGTFVHNGRRIFQHHYAEGRTNAAIVCDASGWIVEDHELRVVARKTRSDAGIAQPSKGPRVTDRVWVCLDGDPPCVPSGRCTDGCRWTVPSPVPQENNGRST